jgi:hypothetical protein
MKGERMLDKGVSRRGLMKGSLLLLALAPLAGWGGKVWADAKKKPIDMSGKSSDPANVAAVNVAKGLGYVDNAAVADKAGKIKRVEKMGVAPANQVCSHCQFYKTADAGHGECMLIQGVLVQAQGYCNSWVKSPNFKA